MKLRSERPWMRRRLVAAPWLAVLWLAVVLVLPAGWAGAQPAPPSGPAAPAAAAVGPSDPAAAPPGAVAPAEPASAPPAPTASHQPGFLDAVGRFMRDSVGNLDSGLKDARTTIDTLGDRATGVAKDAAGTLTTLPATNMVSGRELCAPAANGAPDCRAAAEALCRTKGHPKGGKSIDIQTVHKCPAQVWLSGRTPNPAECALETFVTRAMCN